MGLEVGAFIYLDSLPVRTRRHALMWVGVIFQECVIYHSERDQYESWSFAQVRFYSKLHKGMYAAYNGLTEQKV